jgi:hypothetical protein
MSHYFIAMLPAIWKPALVPSDLCAVFCEYMTLCLQIILGQDFDVYGYRRIVGDQLRMFV